MNRMLELADKGQAVWLDFIRRSFLTGGELGSLIAKGLRGVTSNPAIFEKAIVGSDDYEEEIRHLHAMGQNPREVYETIIEKDIRLAADLLRPVYEKTGGLDGYVSIEVDPSLANDVEGTLNEARRLFALLDRPNVMIKVPATPSGIAAAESLTSLGIPVNMTLIFSVPQYENVAGAYISGLEKLLETGGDPAKAASVASFFISRIDTAVDGALEKAGGPEDLKGKIAVDSARLAYARFREIFSGDRWKKIAGAGGRVQRPLWASTGTKNPAYGDTYYVDSLVGPDTVNTVPPATLEAFMEHGRTAPVLENDIETARERAARLAAASIDLDAITAKLLADGLRAFANASEALMKSIEEKLRILKDERQYLSADPGSVGPAVRSRLENMKNNRVIERIWSGDHTVWKPDPAEITNRLGWLRSWSGMQKQAESLREFADSVRAEGYTNALVMGMGGSSLAPEVFSRSFVPEKGFLEVSVLDSTDPDTVLYHAKRLDPRKTLFIVATKSGGTVEPISFFKFFYNRVLDTVGPEEAGRHFIAITDPGSALLDIAEKFNFRSAFTNDPDIGGRYSALSFFGLVPACLMGVDLEKLLSRAEEAALDAGYPGRDDHSMGDAAMLGAILGEAAKSGRDKMTLIPSGGIESFCDWVEQLVAESTGKEGKGILPVVGEPLMDPVFYGKDRVFVHLRMDGDEANDPIVRDLARNGHPVIVLRLRDVYDIGRQFFLWEMATVLAGASMGINPFDQPNVEAAKILARKMTAAYLEEGKLPGLEPALREGSILVYGDVEAGGLDDVFAGFLARAESGAYTALQAYLPSGPETDRALKDLRAAISRRTCMATTSGYGPRFLHSTGQLHKGDAGKGIFLQFLNDRDEDAGIPDEAGAPGSSISFGILKEAQSLGDRQALLDGGRRVLRFNLGRDVVGALRRLEKALS